MISAVQYSLSDFDYHLPEELIAQAPAHPRDYARLLVYRRSDKSITDTYFYNLYRHIDRNTTLVLNNSKVEKARLLFGNMEVFVLRTFNTRTIEAMVRPGRKFKEGKTVELADGITATVTGIADDGVRRLELNMDIDDARLEPYRRTPFPPYIDAAEQLASEYQTVYAKPLGSKAAPTAGLHFTELQLLDLKAQGFGIEEVTLHVGLGTFAPVKTEDIDDHKLHSETWMVNESTATALSHAKHITAVGTTSVRVLESAVMPPRTFQESSGDTEIFIKPGYQFQAVDSLITNFHLPKSTLLMLVSALTGFDEMHRIYEHAVNERYRFFSFGDAMLIV